jgi:hypothetical protein
MRSIRWLKLVSPWKDYVEETLNSQILEQQRTILAHSLRLIWMGHGNAIAGGVDGILRLGLAILLGLARQVG